MAMNQGVTALEILQEPWQQQQQSGKTLENRRESYVSLKLSDEISGKTWEMGNISGFSWEIIYWKHRLNIITYFWGWGPGGSTYIYLDTWFVCRCHPDGKHGKHCANQKYWLVVSTPLKNISQLGWLFPTEWRKIKMFETTNQIYIYIYMIIYASPQKKMLTWYLNEVVSAICVCQWECLGDVQAREISVCLAICERSTRQTCYI